MKTMGNRIYFLMDLNEKIIDVFPSSLIDQDVQITNGEKMYKIRHTNYPMDAASYAPYLNRLAPIKFDLKSFKSPTKNILDQYVGQLLRAKDFENLNIKATFQSKYYQLLQITGPFVIFTDDTNEILRVSHENRSLRIFNVVENKITGKDTEEQK